MCCLKGGRLFFFGLLGMALADEAELAQEITLTEANTRRPCFKPDFALYL